MKRIVVKVSGMPFDPTNETHDTIAIGDLVRVPGSDSGFIRGSETGTVIALETPTPGPANASSRPRDADWLTVGSRPPQLGINLTLY